MIELVIKIPETAYRQIQALARNGYFEHDICGNSMRRIANGTPLPKEHGRLIDADKLDFEEVDFYSPDSWYEVDRVIDDAPTIIEGSESE